MKLTVGDRLGSVISDVEVIVIRAPSDDVAIRCGGVEMAPLPVERRAASESGGGETLLGKRYEDPASGLELLCTRAGAGALEVEGKRMSVKAAKSLPSSD